MQGFFVSLFIAKSSLYLLGSYLLQNANECLLSLSDSMSDYKTLAPLSAICRYQEACFEHSMETLNYKLDVFSKITVTLFFFFDWTSTICLKLFIVHRLQIAFHFQKDHGTR